MWNIWKDQQNLFESLLQSKTPSSSPDLLTACRHQVYSGGKRLRAMLPYFVCQKLSESTPHSVIEAGNWLGLGVELLHSATLCHDDIMDGDRTRRNQPTVWVKHGIPQAINAGDLLFYLAQEAFHRAPISAPQQLLALQYLSESMQLVIHGQALEIELHREAVLPEFATYRKIVAGKTGGLFSLCIVLGGILSQVSTETLRDFYRIGLEIGEIFQIQDDILDLLGDKGRGSTGNDLWEGKPSWLIAHASSNLPPDLRQELQGLLYKPRTEKTSPEVDRIRELLDQGGAIEAALKYVHDLADPRTLARKISTPHAHLVEAIIPFIQAPVLTPTQASG